MNIEKLAIERKSFEDNYWYRLANSNVPRELLFRVFSDAEHKKGEYINREIQNCWESWLASKALQSSEPYGYVRFENYHNKDAIKGEWLNRTPVSDDDIPVYTHPPATVPLKKYNKLLDALREAKDDIADWGSYAPEFFQQKHDLAGDIAKYDLIIAEADGKEK